MAQVPCRIVSRSVLISGETVGQTFIFGAVSGERSHQRRGATDHTAADAWDTTGSDVAGFGKDMGCESCVTCTEYPPFTCTEALLKAYEPLGQIHGPGTI